MNAKPVPQPTPETQPFWDKCRERELWLPKCADTGKLFFPPRVFSPFTGGGVSWEQASGRAEHMRAPDASFVASDMACRIAFLAAVSKCIGIAIS